MTVALLRRRQDIEGVEVAFPEREANEAEKARDGASDARSLDRLDRWIEHGGDVGATAAREVLPREERYLLAGPADRLGKGALRMVEAEARREAAAALRLVAGGIARSAAVKVSRFFAENGERQALLALSRVPQRALSSLATTLPAKVEAHILEHTRAIADKPVHSLFRKGMSVTEITDLARAAVRSGARPILSVSDNGALAFIFEKEFRNAVGANGERALRLVVDVEGRIVTAFPIAVEKKLATMTIRGVAVAASIAPLLFVSALAQSEEEAATADAETRSAAAQRSTWTEKLLGLFGPYDLFESSPIAVEPNFRAVRIRTEAALDEATMSLERDLTPQEHEAIRRCVYDVWADAAGRTGA